ncbi:MAG: DUF523 and DUF1722 domain-containing protein [Dictyoglomaceae bacterium]|nr:DUF523 and DUF1722 domain-containing protein [Dictyoglomaceae bacterium]
MAVLMVNLVEKNSNIRPILVLSRCLNKEAVRYNGGIITDDFTKKLEKYIEVIRVCPEVDIGMPVPRPPVLLARIDEKIHMIEPESKKDYTEEIEKFSRKFLYSIKEVDGFILKAKSPSCGVKDAKLYQENFKNIIGKTDGLFTKIVRETYPYLPVEDEGRLHDFWIRQNFLTKVFAYADFRALKNKIEKVKDLIKFHQNYKYLLMLYSPSNLKKMGYLIANWDRKGLEETLREYEKLFRDTFLKNQSIKSHINVIQHIYGHFSDLLKSNEKKHFQNLIKKLREDKIYLKIILELIRNYVYRFEDEYLSKQRYLYPYPEELEEI